MLQSALKLAARNMPVFPVHGIIDGKCSCQKNGCPSAGKHPIPSNGFKSATADLPQIEQWWTQHPYANIGLATGKVSGIVVVDIDPRNGGDDSLEELEKLYQPLPRTKEVLTGGNGQHLYFRYLVGGLTCRAGKSGLFRGIDIKGDGGYVVAPPSLHISGHRYEWEVSSYERELTELPEWFLELLQGLATPSPDRHHNSPAGTASRQWGTFLNRSFPEGERNTSLTQIAGYLLSKRTDGYLVLGICQSINLTRCSPPLSEQEVAQIVNSIAQKESLKMGSPYHG